MTAFTTINVSADVEGDPAAVFAHWTDPTTRVRWEAPPESGMRYTHFAEGQGGVDQIEITQGDTVVGQMTQLNAILDAPRLLVSQIVGTFGGATTMAMQVTVAFEATDTGTRITGTSQVVDTTGRDVKAEHEAGWAHLFAAFTEDFARFGQE